MFIISCDSTIVNYAVNLSPTGFPPCKEDLTQSLVLCRNVTFCHDLYRSGVLSLNDPHAQQEPPSHKVPERRVPTLTQGRKTFLRCPKKKNGRDLSDSSDMAPALLTRFLFCYHKPIFRPNVCCLMGTESQTGPKGSRQTVFCAANGLNCRSHLFVSSSSAPPSPSSPPHRDLFSAHHHDITLLPPQGSQQ